MKRREIRSRVKTAQTYLPRHVYNYIKHEVGFQIDRLYEEDEAGKLSRKHSMNGVFAYEVCDDCGHTIPMIYLDERIAPQDVKWTYLHEAGHAWLRYRKLRNTEAMASLLAQLWIMRGIRRSNLKCM